MVKSLFYVACLLLTGLSACVPLKVATDQYKYQKPRVAILEFDNKANLSGQWQLSEGMRDILVDTLLKTDRYTVLTRKDLGAVVTELDIQREAHFRPQGKLQQGNLKNLQYLIKGAVTEFAHVKGGALRLVGSKFGIGGSGDVAIVSLTLYVIKVESGEIIASKTMEGRASAGTVDFNIAYRNIGIGGKTFFRTPLGKATQQVMQKCLEHIAQTIASEQWHPAVVKVEGARIIISGGADRQVAVGSQWSAYEQGESLIDPQTGDLLGREPGKRLGNIRVTTVHDKYSIAEILSGQFNQGQVLRPAEQQDRVKN